MNAAPKDLPSIPGLPESAEQSSTDWRAALAPSRSGYIGDERNILIALRTAPELAALVRYNEFSLEVELTRAAVWRTLLTGSTWNEVDDTELMIWLQSQDIKVRSPRPVADSVAVAARDYSYHPVREYLSALVWDREPRLQIWLVDYLGAQGDPQYLCAVGRKFLISAVARIFQPGCQADHALVLEGAQGIGKTSAARALAVRPEWFAGNLPDIHSKDAPLQLIARWIVEIPELKAIRNTQIEATKAFLTEARDTFRPPYGRRTAQFPRQCVFIGTTNESEYLRDATGNRRYWPIKCASIDIPALIRDRDQLWAEAVQLYRESQPWHLTDEEAQLATLEQQERVHISELEHDVRDYLERQGSQGDITVREVLVHGLSLDPDKPTYAAEAKRLGPAVAEALERAGWRKAGRRGKERRTTYIRRQG